MKFTRENIKEMSNRSHSHADALATLYEMIAEEIIQERKISRRKIRASVDMTMKEHGYMRPLEDEYALAEAVFAAAGWTIVDDDLDTGLETLDRFAIENGLQIDYDPEMQGITQPQTGEQAKRLRTLHQARELLDSLINETAKKEPDNVKGWQPIETEPKDRDVIFLAFSDRPEANGVRGFWAAEEKYIPIYGGRFASQPTHWMPIPPLPESDK